MSEQDEIALLRAQLIQCTTAMREAVNTMENTNLAFAPDMEGSIRRVTDLLKTARGSAVTHDQIEQFRAGEWQKARQDAERLEREIKLLQDENKARSADQDAAVKEWCEMKLRVTDLEAALDGKEHALQLALTDWRKAQKHLEASQEEYRQLEEHTQMTEKEWQKLEALRVALQLIGLAIQGKV